MVEEEFLSRLSQHKYMKCSLGITSNSCMLLRVAEGKSILLLLDIKPRAWCMLRWWTGKKKGPRGLIPLPFLLLVPRVTCFSLSSYNCLSPQLPNTACMLNLDSSLFGVSGRQV